MHIPLVSICIPTFNRVQTLERAINSALSQSHRNCEIIISDNGSSDETQDLLNSLSASHSNIIYTRQQKNCGPVKNFQLVKKSAKGKYFMWLGDDDWISKDYIATCVQKLEGDSSLIMVAGLGVYCHKASDTHLYGNTINLLSQHPILRLIKYLFLVEDNSTFYGVYRRQVLVGREMPDIFAGDWAWICEVALLGKICVDPSVKIFREYGDSTTATYERLTEVYGYPAWMAKIPNIASAITVSKFLLFNCVNFRHNWRYIFYSAIAFVTLLFRAIYLGTREFLYSIVWVKLLVKAIKKAKHR